MKSLEDKLADKIIRRDIGCWDWTGSFNVWGYGKIRPESIEKTCSHCGHTSMERQKQKQAHRVVYESMVGPIPSGLVLDHLCGNRGCVRPDHLEPVTQSTNVKRSKSGTCPQGHSLSGDNLYEWNGKRSCKTCRSAAAARFKAKVK